jgi:hypothetical protein
MTIEMAWTARLGRRGAGVLLASLFALALLAAGSPPAVHALKNRCDVSPYCVTLTVAPFGDGPGVVQSAPNMGGAPNGYIECHRSGGVTSGTCSHQYFNGIERNPVTVFLRYTTAPPGTPVDGTYVVCTKPQIECYGGSWTEAYTFDKDSTAERWGFFPWHPIPVAVTISGPGVGKVASNPVGIKCGQSGTACSFTFPQDSVVTLKATAAAASVFQSWTGDCDGQGAVCSLTLPHGRSTEAVFAKAPPTPSPMPTKKPAASRTPTPSAAPAGTASTAASSSPPGTADTSPGSPSASAAEVAAISSPQPTAGGGPAAAASSDGGGLVALAILGAGLLIAVGIGFAGYELRRRGRTP